MRVGWLHSDPGYVGGAELTMQEFRATSPCEVVDGTDAETIVVGNCVRYEPEIIAELRGKKVFRYHHDLAKHEPPELRGWLNDHASHIFCSPMQQDYFDLEGHLIPPALDLERFKPSRQARRNGHREGTCSVAGWRNPGKGAIHLLEWARDNGPVDVYGDGEFIPRGPNLEQKGPVEPNQVAQTLWAYERFVFLPFDSEPFCRSVVEAYASGMEVVTNKLVGALWWLSERPDGLKTAGRDFWSCVLDS